MEFRYSCLILLVFSVFNSTLNAENTSFEDVVEKQANRVERRLGQVLLLPPRSGKMRTKPYWLWHIAGGIGYELLESPDASVSDAFSNRTPILRSSLTAGITRTFGKRFGASMNFDYGRRHDRYSISTTLASNSGSLVRTSSAYFSELNFLLTASYLVPTRECDFQVYGGVGYSFLQDWTGERIYLGNSSDEVIVDTTSPYTFGGDSSRMRYTIGTRAAKPVNEFLYLVFDSQVLLQSAYQVDTDKAQGSEIGNSVNIRLGVGYRFE